MDTPHAGDLTATDTYRLLADDPQAVLVDVRTAPEWAYVGLPELGSIGKQVVRVEWTRFPDGAANEAFLDQLDAAGIDPAGPVAFICRSGARSAAAAAAASAAGYRRAYNVADGFEGPLDAAGHRGGAAGWKASGLPWSQS